MAAVFAENDWVVVDLGSRRRDALLACGDAHGLAAALRHFAAQAEKAAPTLARGERWECKVQSYDGFVALRLFPPHVGAPSRVRLPPAAARALADRVEFKAQQAAYKVTFRFC